MSNSEPQPPSWHSGALQLGLLFVVAYLLLMLLWVPVHWAYPRFPSLLPAEPRSQLPVIRHLQGTLWQGRAEEIALPLELRLLSWQWDPRALLSAALGYQLTLGGPQNQARVALGWDRSLSISELSLDGRLSDWVANFQGQPLPLDVAISARLIDARLSEQGCLGLRQGQLALHNWQGLMSESLNRIGTIDATLTCVDGGLGIDFEGQTAQLQLSGQWRLGPDRRYSLTAEAHPQAIAIQDSLRGAGFVERRTGVWRLTRQGQL